MPSVKEMTAMTESLRKLLGQHTCVLLNPSRRELIGHVLGNREAIASANGALATWTRPDSTGRSPKDTYIVRHPDTESTVDWESPNCIPLAPDTMDLLWADALEVLGRKQRLYATDRVAGADPRYALPIRMVSDRALHSLFADNMFRPVPEGIERSVFAERGFTMLVLPFDRLDPARYEGRLRKMPDGTTSTMAIVMDFDRGLGLVYGSSYCGSVKKLIFTVMNYLLPAEGILPLHCAANEATDGPTALLLGLSGTGKTSLSADPARTLLGDDEHGWSDDGIANFENGCYAKLINLREEKEGEIFRAVFHEAEPQDHGAIVENCMMYPDGVFDVDDERLTPNSRGSYPLSFLSNVKEPPTGAHPRTILFLTADANGVLPPVSRLDADQAMLWFLMGYTCKLAGTETGVKEPKSTFSRFFGAPFMARKPDVYAALLGQKLDKHHATTFLINTGWSGGGYGEGARIDITMTRAMVEAALSGRLDSVAYKEDPLFHVLVPETCPGVPSELLQPRNTWKDKEAFDRAAQKLAAQFSEQFDKAYGKAGIDPRVAAQCPGR